MENSKFIDVKQIFDEFSKGTQNKELLGERGLLEQAKINERFFIGDQWYGVQAGNSRPLVRRNLIRRIGEYKISAVGSQPVAVNYSAEGVDTFGDTDVLAYFDSFSCDSDTVPKDSEISAVMAALSGYQSVTAERVNLNGKLERALKDAYISGTSFIFTYWDDSVKTGLFADDDKKSAVTGDINCQVLNLENVVLGDISCEELQNQPYIIIRETKQKSDVLREAKAYGNTLKPESFSDQNGKTTVLTKLYKQYDETSRDYSILATKVCEAGVIRYPFDLKIKRYPLSVFCWDKRKNCAFGESEITYLLGNQIAVNRALTAAVWATMSAGMPKMMVNDAYCSDVKITNDPGQIIRVPVADVPLNEIVSYITPPTFAPQFETLVGDLATNTLLDSGANDVALGNVRPDNASAIIEIRQAALQPIKIYQNRFYRFCEDIASTWMEFWLHFYGCRKIKYCADNQTRYLPFDFDRYKNLIVCTKVDVGAATVWSEAASIETLGKLLEQGVITTKQYLERLPKGVIPDVDGLLVSQAQNEPKSNPVLQLLKQKYPEHYKKFEALSSEQKQRALAKATLKEAVS